VQEDCFPDGQDFPTNTWIGMKFIIKSGLGSDEVKLELYMDKNETGVWELVTDFVDTTGAMPSPVAVPTECPQDNGDPVLRPGNMCFLRADMSTSDTSMLWKIITWYGFVLWCQLWYLWGCRVWWPSRWIRLVLYWCCEITYL
jgi:hypothetical protein